MGVKSSPLLSLYSWRNNGEFLNYEDRNLGAKWAVGPYYTDASAEDPGSTCAGSNSGKATASVFIPKTS